jgi:DNA recombination protein Rad52
MNVHDGRQVSKQTSGKGAPAPRDGFSTNQLKKLSRALDPTCVHVRNVDSRKLSYIEGWFAIAQANDIFGPSAWDREMVHFERVFERACAGTYTCGYLARVRVRVRAGTTQIIREGTGWGAASTRTLSDAHERALKSAETDATKRALATFGNQFGLCLYERTAGADKPTFALVSADGATLASPLSPESFCGGLRQLIEASKTERELDCLAENNARGIRELKAQSPHLKNKQGEHYADILSRLIDQAREKFQVAERAVRSSGKSADVLADQAISDSFSKGVTLGNEDFGDQKAGADEVTRGQDPEADHDDLRQKANDEVLASDGVATSIKPLTPEEALAPSRIATGSRIDKSRLVFGVTEKRLRDKQHLRRVASLPCLICSRQPSHPHHLRFAQKRGLGQKVSDEFVVPLCALHHGELHRSQSEMDWWKRRNVDPLPISSELWARRNGHI